MLAHPSWGLAVLLYILLPGRAPNDIWVCHPLSAIFVTLQLPGWVLASHVLTCFLIHPGLLYPRWEVFRTTLLPLHLSWHLCMFGFCCFSHLSLPLSIGFFTCSSPTDLVLAV